MRPRAEERSPRSLSSDIAPHDTSRSAAHGHGRRLVRLEYVLLALIAVGVAVTLTMAVIDPSG